MDRLNFIRDGGFFEQNSNFFPVWSGPEIEIDHLSPPCGWLVASNRNINCTRRPEARSEAQADLRRALTSRAQCDLEILGTADQMNAGITKCLFVAASATARRSEWKG